MALFTLIGRDGPRGLELRQQHREAHLQRIERLDADGRIRHAGPLLDGEGRPVGSVVVFEAEDLEAARSLAARDPYVAEGIFESHEVFETRAIFPKSRPAR